MFSYFAYGLGVHSDLLLPEFIAVETKCDVTINVKCNSLEYLEISEDRAYIKITPEETIVSIRNIGTFQILRGCEVIVAPAPNADYRLIQLCIAGSIMAILLYQRGIQVLHASAVEINGDVVAFLGASGAGKSSTAAALHACGCNIITDDLVSINSSTVPATIFPGYPQIKLSPEVAIALGYDVGSLIFLHPYLGEYAYRSDKEFPRIPLLLKRLYVLTDFNDLRIEPLQPQEAILELIRNSYGIRVLKQAMKPTSHFLQCAELAKNVPIYRLKRPRSLSLLPELARLVKAHLNCDFYQAKDSPRTAFYG